MLRFLRSADIMAGLPRDILVMPVIKIKILKNNDFLIIATIKLKTQLSN